MGVGPWKPGPLGANPLDAPRRAVALVALSHADAVRFLVGGDQAPALRVPAICEGRRPQTVAASLAARAGPDPVLNTSQHSA